MLIVSLGCLGSSSPGVGGHGAGHGPWASSAPGEWHYKGCKGCDCHSDQWQSDTSSLKLFHSWNMLRSFGNFGTSSAIRLWSSRSIWTTCWGLWLRITKRMARSARSSKTALLGCTRYDHFVQHHFFGLKPSFGWFLWIPWTPGPTGHVNMLFARLCAPWTTPT